MKIDLFVLAIIASIIAAYLFPGLGTSDSPVDLDRLAKWGIALIFFFYGLKLSTDDLRSGVGNWRLHLITQGSTFLLFPLIIIIFYPFVKGTNYELTWLSFLFMAALPSTVSSSVVMVAMAKGNLPGAIFNASISGIIGILITPLWMSPFVSQSSVDYDFTTIYVDLITQILVPLIAGLLLRPSIGLFFRKNNRWISIFDKTVILLIIYKSFVHSFEDNIFGGIALLDLIILFAFTIIVFYGVYGLTGWIGKKMKFNREDRITAQFCGTKKSLVHGTVFSEALFGQTTIVGLMLLPLMIFHAFQIFVISIIATNKGREME